VKEYRENILHGAARKCSCVAACWRFVSRHIRGDEHRALAPNTSLPLNCFLTSLSHDVLVLSPRTHYQPLIFPFPSLIENHRRSSNAPPHAGGAHEKSVVTCVGESTTDEHASGELCAVEHSLLEAACRQERIAGPCMPPSRCHQRPHDAKHASLEAARR
jgi:hypothetical protein